jgi:ERCC4-type nuclease
MASVLLKIDHREGKLKELFGASGPCTIPMQLEYENLEYGDFQLVYNNEVKFIFERKTIDDLLASIKDGRYNNQKARLFEVYAPSQIYYIIEGTVKMDDSKTQDKIVLSSLINTALRDKIGIFQTKSLNDTFQLLCGIYMRFKEHPEKYLGSAQKSEAVVVMSSNKSTSTHVFKAILCQIPGVSDKTADGLMERWKCMKLMIDELCPLTSEKQEELLGAIKINGRKISKKVVEGICQYIFGKSA